MTVVLATDKLMLSSAGDHFFCAQEPSARVVGFKVEPFSVKHAFQSGSATWSGTPGEMPPLSTCDKDNFIDPVKLTTVGLPLKFCFVFLTGFDSVRSSSISLGLFCVRFRWSLTLRMCEVYFVFFV